MWVFQLPICVMDADFVPLRSLEGSEKLILAGPKPDCPFSLSEVRNKNRTHGFEVAKLRPCAL